MKQTSPAVPYLCISSFGQTAWIDLDESSNALIGSGSHCKIQISGSDVRSLHCIVAMKDGRLEVRDWNTGCTFVNGQVINEPTELKEGDSLKIGDHEITAVLSESGQAEIQSLITAKAEAEAKAEVEDQPESPVVELVADETAEFETPSPRAEVQTLVMDSPESFVQPETPASEFVAAETAEFAAPSPRAEAQTLVMAGTEADVLPETPVDEAVEIETAETDACENPEPRAEAEPLELDATGLKLQNEMSSQVDEVEVDERETGAASTATDEAVETAFGPVAENEFNEEPAAIEEGEPVAETEVQHESELPEPEFVGEVPAAESEPEEPAAIEEGEPVAETEVQHELELPEPEFVSEVPAAESEPEPEGEAQIPVQSEVPVEAQAPVGPEVQAEPEVRSEVSCETETDARPAVAPAEFVYDVDADFEDETDYPAFGFASPGFADEMYGFDELQTLRTENEQLRFELNEQAKRSSRSEANSELLSREQTVRLVSRLEDMLAELKRSDARSLQLEELLRSADQATRDEQEERMQMEKWVSELESRITRRESESNGEIQSLKKLLEEARHSQQKSNDSLQSVIASRADGESVPEELVSGLRQQIESLQTQLKSSQEECTTLREQLENRPDSGSEDLKQVEQQLAEMRLEASRERAEVSHQRVELQRLRAELEERISGPREANDADTRIRAMREHLKELHDEGEKAKANRSGSAVSSGLGNRIASLLQRVAGE